MRILAGENKESSCWYNRFQIALYLLAFLTIGIGDAISSLWMIQHQGILRETNPIVKYILINFNSLDYFLIKIILTLAILLMIFLLQLNSEEPVYWTINGLLISFMIMGTVAIILNIQAGMKKDLFLATWETILLFLALFYSFTRIGEEIDRRSRIKIKSYSDCILKDIRKILSLYHKMQMQNILFWPAQK